METNHAELFMQHRSAMMSIAYRMLGSICEAEDVVSDVFIRWGKQDISKIQNAKAWLLKACSNASLDLLKKSYKQREVYPGTWLPEPLINDFSLWQEDPSNSDSISTAFLLMLEKLNPVERTVFLLHDVFSYSFREISLIVERSESNCRKIGERARKRLQSDRTKFDAPSATDLVTLERFFTQLKLGDIEQIKSLLAEGAEFWSDGGGKVSAIPIVLTDPRKICKFFISIIGHAEQRNETYKPEFVTVNHRQGLILNKQFDQANWHMETVFSFEFIEGKIARIYAVRNPDKLKLVHRVY